MNKIRENIRLCIECVVLLAVSAMLTSCFTGIESTKKIKYTAEDRRTLREAEDASLLDAVKPIALKDWEIGKKWIAADDRTLLIFERRGLPQNPEEAKMAGKVLSYQGTVTVTNPDNNPELIIIFSDGENVYRYPTGKEPDEARYVVLSDRLPLLTDYAMLEQAAQILKDKELWTRTNLWYDEEGNKVAGRKFVKVRVTDVRPGWKLFPMTVEFTDLFDGRKAYMLMNFDRDTQASRPFGNIFSLTDPRKRYPRISDEVWANICNATVAKGMTKEECRLALGNPSDADAGRSYSETIDLWKYPDGTFLRFADGVLVDFRK